MAKLDRLGQSLLDLPDSADGSRANGTALAVGRTAYDPSDPVCAFLFLVPSMAAEFKVAMNRAGVTKTKPGGKDKSSQHKHSAEDVSISEVDSTDVRSAVHATVRYPRPEH